jgi:16S rRNA processing protein RimM
MNWDDMVLVGRIARTHGTRGHVIVNPETDFPEERFKPGNVVYVRRPSTVEPLTIEGARFHQGRPIVVFGGVADLTAAEALTGVELRIPVEALAPLPEGTFYRHDLVGCCVVTTAGGNVGRVVRVDGTLGSSLLVIDGERGEILVPMVSSICVRVDPRARELVIDPPAGLLEANEREP